MHAQLMRGTCGEGVEHAQLMRGTCGDGVEHAQLMRGTCGEGVEHAQLMRGVCVYVCCGLAVGQALEGGQSRAGGIEAGVRERKGVVVFVLSRDLRGKDAPRVYVQLDWLGQSARERRRRSEAGTAHEAAARLGVTRPFDFVWQCEGPLHTAPGD
ncbi:unnamed protein product [Lampetra planeri]